MATRTRRGHKAPGQGPVVSLTIDGLSHEGRGVGRLDGKTVFVEGALPGEAVSARITNRRGRFDEARLEAVMEASPARITPVCEYFGVCGGCSLQHLSADSQILHKQKVLQEQFRHLADFRDFEMLPPMQDAETGYRQKARLSVKTVARDNRVLVGFRQVRSNHIADIDHCAVLDTRASALIKPLKQLIAGLDSRFSTPQLEVAIGDETVALVVRHLQPLSDADRQAWCDFGQQYDARIYLQPGNPASTSLLWPEAADERLWYRLPDFDLQLGFLPLDFTQVNGAINRRMVKLAIELLELERSDRVLDLFCGLGNFSLPAATLAGQVTGIEGDDDMVSRAAANARHNNLQNVQFYRADLFSERHSKHWKGKRFDKVLIDPPRTGALEAVRQMKPLGARRIVYVSCNPATLARDAGELGMQGYRLEKAGVMDMFPHTAHVESIALFVRD